MVIVLDPGHGGNADSNRGFVGSGNDRNEGINNYLTCIEIRDYLKERYICEIKMTRNSMSENPWPGRGSMFGAVDLFYSRHTNAFNGQVRGTEVIVGTRSPAASLLAYAICSKESELFGHNNRGLIKDDTFIVIKEAQAAGAKMAMLAEIGFHDNITDANFMTGSRKKVAAWEGEIIAQHMKLPLIPKASVEQAASGMADYGFIYAVRTGSFKYKDNANATLAKVKAAGFLDAVIELVPFSKEA